LLSALLLLPAISQSPALQFHAGDPMLEDDDRLIDVAEPLDEIELSDLYDRVSHLFHVFGDPTFPAFTESHNVNTLDEVPDSSWFTNRGDTPAAELIADFFEGPPDTDDTWTIFAGKSQGFTPGLFIIDGHGVRYVVKFHLDLPELLVSAEVIGAKLFHSLGYNVPQNYAVRLHPDNLVIEPGTTIENRWGEDILLTEARVRSMLRDVPRGDDGRMLVVASRFIDGSVIGPYRFYGTRSDDPNDVIPHEHRRELRGLRLFSAWTNHDDSRAQNTQASLVEADGKRHVRHWLIDFGSMFGAGDVDLQVPKVGRDYWFAPAEVLKGLMSFGFHVPKYREVEWPNYPKYEAVGRWEAEYFDPLEWRNEYLNPAFVRMTPRDAFWAAKLLMRFSYEELEAIVNSAEFVDAEQAHFFLEVLVERQQKSGRFGINLLNPLDGFAVSDDVLVFENLSERYGFVAPGTTSYRTAWSLYDNAAGRVQQALGSPLTGTVTHVPLAEPERYLADRDLLLMVEISSMNADHPDWERPVRVYLRSTGTTYEVVGIERDSPDEYVPMS
jgi:hypothetical protein